MKRLIKNVRLIKDAHRNEIPDGLILYEGNVITYAGEKKDIDSAEYDQVIDGKGCMAIPGLVNCHSHAPMVILRNIANDMKLEDWLFGRILPLEANLQGEDYYWGTMLAICEMISSGTTCFLDMYLDMEQCATAVLDSKMRVNISKNTLTSDKKTDRGTIFDGKAYEQFVKQYGGAGEGRITTSMEIHSLYLYEPELIRESVDLAVETNSTIHIHVLETQAEKKNIETKYKMRALEAMDRMGMFQVPVIAAHMVHVDDTDIKFMKNKPIYPVHNPTSNLKLASGISPVDSMLKEGICVCLGTDGAASNNNLNMMEEMHIASLIHKGVKQDSKLVSARETFQMATLNGAKALNCKIGKLEEGYLADIVLLDETGVHNAPGFGDPVEQVVYSMQASDVKTVIINGETVMKNREITGMDTEKIIAKVKNIRKRLES